MVSLSMESVDVLQNINSCVAAKGCFSTIVFTQGGGLDMHNKTFHFIHINLQNYCPPFYNNALFCVDQQIIKKKMFYVIAGILQGNV